VRLITSALPWTVLHPFFCQAKGPDALARVVKRTSRFLGVPSVCLKMILWVCQMGEATNDQRSTTNGENKDATSCLIRLG
jgi:hypothetical protein